MIGPKKKISITKKHHRFGEWQRRKLKKITNKVSLVKCNNCGKYKLTHRVCPNCGFYGDKQIITIKSKEKIIEG